MTLFVNVANESHPREGHRKHKTTISRQSWPAKSERANRAANIYDSDSLVDRNFRRVGLSGWR